MRTSILRVPRRDIVIAAVVTALTVPPALIPHRQPWWVLVLAALTSVPVLWRGRSVFAVGAVVGSAMTVLAVTYKALVHPPLLLLPYGVLVATYTFAAAPMSPFRRCVGVAGLAVGVVVSLVVPHENLETYRYLVTAIAAAYAIGVSTRARGAGRDAVRERERRVREERAAAVERERTRIARDMHDILTHSVGLMVVQAEAGPLVVHKEPARAEAAFEAIAATGRDAVGQLRLILGALRDGEPYEGPDRRDPRIGLDGVPGLVAGARRAGLDASIDVRGQPRKVTADVNIAAYRIVQEALTNTIRHAAARSVRVRLRWCPDSLRVEVADDGRGASVPREGHGIIGMRERVTACGGTLAVRDGSPGFTVTATLPIG